MKIDEVQHMILTKKQDDDGVIMGYDCYVLPSTFKNQKVQ